MWCVWFRLLSAGIVASVVACTPAAQRAPTPSADLTGVWIGKFTLGCVPPLASPRCLNRQDISFTFVEQEATVNGFYECTFRDHPCTAQQHGGRVTRIDATPHMLLIKVRMDDGASCTFGVTARKNNEMTGGCICFEVWGQSQKGWWHVRRTY